MKDNEKEQNAQKEEKQGLSEEKETLPSDWREVIYQHWRDMGIKVTDVTDELEGTTTIIIPFGRPSQKNKNENNEKKERE
ncbi:MAG: hypothetical protein NT092_10275 [Bacteroidia bacterium]|nr:hypothetical protein [Bacteroidia bacterium]